jgi:hypothetical protein
MKLQMFISFYFVVLALLSTMMGGLLDITNQERVSIPGTSYSITKWHFWNDGLFFLAFAVGLKLLLK